MELPYDQCIKTDDDRNEKEYRYDPMAEGLGKPGRHCRNMNRIFIEEDNQRQEHRCSYGGGACGTPAVDRHKPDAGGGIVVVDILEFSKNSSGHFGRFVK